jgi:hypothetical protein
MDAKKGLGRQCKNKTPAPLTGTGVLNKIQAARLGIDNAKSRPIGPDVKFSPIEPKKLSRWLCGAWPM